MHIAVGKFSNIQRTLMKKIRKYENEDLTKEGIKNAFKKQKDNQAHYERTPKQL